MLITGTGETDEIFKKANRVTRNSKNQYLNNQLNIEVNGVKQISSMLNQGTVKISNLTYAEIYRIIEGQFYEIEIWAGYRSQNLERYFKGEIAYISDEITMKKGETILLAASTEDITIIPDGTAKLLETYV